MFLYALKYVEGGFIKIFFFSQNLRRANLCQDPESDRIKRSCWTEKLGSRRILVTRGILVIPSFQYLLLLLCLGSVDSRASLQPLHYFRVAKIAKFKVLKQYYFL